MLTNVRSLLGVRVGSIALTSDNSTVFKDVLKQPMLHLGVGRRSI